MPLTDLDRIAAQRLKPRAVTLWQALTALRSCVSFMNSGAHPDDETTAMLAAMRFRDGIDISFACANRGEGGQNALGPEITRDLGTIRTAEMERAADIIDLRHYWLSETPEDTIFDFGFSKLGTETLEKWGHARTLARFVHIVRRERPDMLCPTFLDIPGQHGHHRAMTALAHEVVRAAADPAFPSDLPPWRIAKLYLPAWSGAGDAYDDDLPPPPATVTVAGADSDPVTGWSFAQIGQQSRAFHQTQGMGHWIDGAGQDWPLHLVDGGKEASLFDGLPRTLSDLPATGPLAEHLGRAHASCEAAIAAWPSAEAVLKAASEALDHIWAAQSEMGEAFARDHGHRLSRKEEQLARIRAIAAGANPRLTLAQDVVRPGGSVGYVAHGGELVLPDGWTPTDDTITLPRTAKPSDPYPDTYLPGITAHGPALCVAVTAHGVTSETLHPAEQPLVVLPSHSARLDPEAAILNLANNARDIPLQITDIVPGDAAAELTLPKGWRHEDGRVIAPDDLRAGKYTLPLTLDGTDAQAVRIMHYPHTGPRMRAEDATLTVRAMTIALPEGRIAYVGGGSDRVDVWLRRAGVTLDTLEGADLTAERLAGYDTLLIGIFALRTRPKLAALMPRVHDWVQAGGNLVTLYHRPWDAWDPAHTPPRPLEIGKPSLRWRVTDERAEVTHLLPDHPLLTTPNQIGPQDWAEWDKERGLYFAKSWDAAYAPLLSMADRDEAPHQGALLSAEIGKGRHTHCALILHHQLDKLVPGAYRLLANMLHR
ncbi:LmbE family N-acetylglucosaminyl deacetylase [Rubricella aquisinus]|uniref:LmbE family N-acetylglucosaminyl deacetylase n=1 Tax=Rubricella aquisinus TaxID=2028108 RepID=A0A840WN50_9RHOB|nr:PIG-L family deacetylase [Rubricella aquisinus]MBB5516479.1 LmbE family N-acetylglucosaminyl deacetylase [Rubricella aquisinus]